MVRCFGLGKKSAAPKTLYQDDLVKQCSAIGPYLVPDSLAYVQKANEPIGEQSPMLFGNMPRDGVVSQFEIQRR